MGISMRVCLHICWRGSRLNTCKWHCWILAHAHLSTLAIPISVSTCTLLLNLKLGHLRVNRCALVVLMCVSCLAMIMFVGHLGFPELFLFKNDFVFYLSLFVGICKCSLHILVTNALLLSCIYLVLVYYFLVCFLLVLFDEQVFYFYHSYISAILHCLHLMWF